MNRHQQHERSETGYRQLKQEIDASYARGWYVAIADDQILAASADFHELERMLQAEGKDRRDVLVVEAGVDYPEHLTIFI